MNLSNLKNALGKNTQTEKPGVKQLISKAVVPAMLVVSTMATPSMANTDVTNINSPQQISSQATHLLQTNDVDAILDFSQKNNPEKLAMLEKDIVKDALNYEYKVLRENPEIKEKADNFLKQQNLQPTLENYNTYLNQNIPDYEIKKQDFASEEKKKDLAEAARTSILVSASNEFTSTEDKGVYLPFDNQSDEIAKIVEDGGVHLPFDNQEENINSLPSNAVDELLKAQQPTQTLALN